MLKAKITILNPMGRKMAEKHITDNFHDTDTAHDGYSVAGLRRDPLELPSENEIRKRFIDKLYNEATSTSSAFVRDYWQKRVDEEKSLKTNSERWEALIRLMLMNPRLATKVAREIEEPMPNIPNDYLQRIDLMFEKKK